MAYGAFVRVEHLCALTLFEASTAAIIALSFKTGTVQSLLHLPTFHIQTA